MLGPQLKSVATGVREGNSQRQQQLVVASAELERSTSQVQELQSALQQQRQVIALCPNKNVAISNTSDYGSPHVAVQKVEGANNSSRGFQKSAVLQLLLLFLLLPLLKSARQYSEHCLHSR